MVVSLLRLAAVPFAPLGMAAMGRTHGIESKTSGISSITTFLEGSPGTKILQ